MEEERETKKVFCGGIPYKMTDEEFEELFKPYGEIKNCFVAQGKGFGFCNYEEAESADKAIKALDGTEFQGRTLKVDYARPKNK